MNKAIIKSLKASVVIMLLFSLIACTTVVNIQEQSSVNVNVAMLHIAPKLAETWEDIWQNAKLVEQGMREAKAKGAEWVMTPELSLTGYRFKYNIGTDWFEDDVDRWTRYLQQKADELDIVLFLSHLEKEGKTQLAYNTLFVIDGEGEILAKHRKINTIPGSESWSSKGREATTVSIPLNENMKVNVGLLICADAWPESHSQLLKQQGADVIVSTANWAPGLYGPGETWQKRAFETGLPVFVNNRTGIEDTLDMTQAQSVVAVPSGTTGKRLFSHHSLDNQIVMFTFDFANDSLQGLNKLKF